MVPRIEMTSTSNNEKRKKRTFSLWRPHHIPCLPHRHTTWCCSILRRKLWLKGKTGSDGRAEREILLLLPSQWNRWRKHCCRELLNVKFLFSSLFLWIRNPRVTVLAIDGEMNNQLRPWSLRLCLWCWRWQQIANHFYGRICVCVRHFSNWIRKCGLPYICLHSRAPANAFPVLNLGWWIE